MSERAGPWRRQPSLSALYSHQARRSGDDESPSAQHRASQQYVLFCFYAIGEPQKIKTSSSVSSTAEHFQRKRSPRSGLGCVRSRCPSLFRLHRGCRVRISPPDRVAGGPHRCAAVSSAVINIGARSGSPESGQWRPRKRREPRSLRALSG